MMGAIRSVSEFYACRIVLGIAEAGFFPGIVIYLSHWFPRADRARAIGALAIGLPAANLIGAPISSWLLSQNWLDVPGWRWIFIVEGFPSVIAGIATMVYLKDRPRDAKWLTPPERAWLEQKLASEHTGPGQNHTRTLFSTPFLILVLIWFLDNVGVYGFNLWLPMMIGKMSGYGSATVVAISSAPFIGALIAAAYVSLSSDSSGERRWHTALPMILFGAGLSLSVLLSANFWVSMAALCIAALGLTSGTPGFWAVATASRHSSSSIHIAIITSAGALGGLCGPYVMGYLRQATGGFETGMVLLSVCVIAAGVLVSTSFRESAKWPLITSDVRPASSTYAARHSGAP